MWIIDGLDNLGCGLLSRSTTFHPFDYPTEFAIRLNTCVYVCVCVFPQTKPISISTLRLRQDPQSSIHLMRSHVCYFRIPHTLPSIQTPQSETIQRGIELLCVQKRCVLDNPSSAIDIVYIYTCCLGIANDCFEQTPNVMKCVNAQRTNGDIQHLKSSIIQSQCLTVVFPLKKTT